MADERGRGASRRVGVGAIIVLVLAGLAITVGIGIARGAGSAGTAIVTPAASSSTRAGGGAEVDAGGAVYVHVAGAVAAPGLYRLQVGARVVDAIGAAGGFAADADRASVNLARTIEDGEQIVVPVVGAAPAESSAGGGKDAPGSGSVIDLNDADATQLDALPRIGPALAERIVAWREDNGRFTSVDDLLSVPGIGEKTVEGLRDLVRV